MSSLQGKPWPVQVVVLASFIDVLVHAVIQQFELARALVALALVLWVLVWSQWRLVGWSAVTAYVIVNGWFISQAGWVNSETGAPRILWGVFVGVSLVMSGVILYRQSRRG